MIDELKRDIRQRLSDSSPRILANNCEAEAAVLISVFQREGEPCLLLTERTQEVATHKGQISFPGGRRDEQDSSLRATALRETEEEVGIAADWVEIMGQFDEYRSKTNLRVRPFVGFLKEGFTVSPNPREVARILEVPLQFFSQTTPREEVRQRHGRQVTLYFYEYESDVIWGLTAAIIRDLMRLLT
jgi:8-oxo-dGTP pyrophosphatase MutT (NUDIX family)